MRRALLIGWLTLAAGCMPALTDRCATSGDCLRGAVCRIGHCVDPATKCDTCQLTAVTPQVAAAGDTLTLDGTFGEDTQVTFPDHTTIAVTLHGPHRATVRVPPRGGTDAGKLVVRTGPASVGQVPFRRVSFTPALRAGTARHEQGLVARTEPRLPTMRAGFGTVVTQDSSNGTNYVHLVGGDNAGSNGERATLHADGTITHFIVDDPPLASPRLYHSVVTVLDEVYALGGDDGSGMPAASERSEVQPNGRLGSFFSPAGPPIAARRAAALVVGDAIYLFGGLDPTTGQPTDRVLRVALKPDHTLDDAVEVAPLQRRRAGAVAFAAGPYVYIAGGEGSPDAGTTVERAAFDEQGALGGSQVYLSSHLKERRVDATAVRLGNTALIVGGQGNTTIETASLDSDGTLRDFALSSAHLSVEHAGAGAVLSSNVLWVIGGTGNDKLDPVGFDGVAKLAPPSTFAHSTGDPLPFSQANQCLVVFGQKLYSIAGRLDDLKVIDDIVAADIAADGSVTAPKPLVRLNRFVRWAHTCAVVGDRLYVLGGFDSSGVATSLIQHMSINPDGTLGQIEDDTQVSLTPPVGMHAIAVAGGYLHVLGGRADRGSDPSSATGRFPITGNELGPYEASTPPLATPRRSAMSVALGGTVYLLGGITAKMSIEGTNDVERYDVQRDGRLRFATAPQTTLSNNRVGAATALLRGDVLLLGGGAKASMSDGYIDLCDLAESCNPPVSGVLLGGDGRQFASAAILGNQVWVVGGLVSNTMFLKTLELLELQ